MYICPSTQAALKTFLVFVDGIDGLSNVTAVIQERLDRRRAICTCLCHHVLDV